MRNKDFIRSYGVPRNPHVKKARMFIMCWQNARGILSRWTEMQTGGDTAKENYND